MCVTVIFELEREGERVTAGEEQQAAAAAAAEQTGAGWWSNRDGPLAVLLRLLKLQEKGRQRPPPSHLCAFSRSSLLAHALHYCTALLTIGLPQPLTVTAPPPQHRPPRVAPTWRQPSAYTYRIFLKEPMAGKTERQPHLLPASTEQQ